MIVHGPIKKYLDAPTQVAASRQRQSKLDPFKAVIAECLEKDPRVTAALILQRIKDLGYSGGHAILQEYVHRVRPNAASKRAFVRIEPFAGERFEVDWAHFDALNYSGDIRKRRFWLLRWKTPSWIRSLSLWLSHRMAI